MLIRYKKSLEKIAMGLLSFMPDCKEVKRLMETIHQYEDMPNWMLYLWKKDDEYVGIVGLHVEEQQATIQHITVVPSYRGEGIAQQMLLALQEEYHFECMQPNSETAPFVEKCLQTITDVG